MSYVCDGHGDCRSSSDEDIQICKSVYTSLHYHIESFVLEIVLDAGYIKHDNTEILISLSF